MKKPVEYVKDYASARDAVVRHSAYLGIGSLLLAVIVRSPSFELKLDPIGGGIHNGYVMVYGNIIILILAVWYVVGISDVIGIRDRLFEDQKKLPEAERPFLGVERFMLRAPFSMTSDSPSETQTLTLRAIQTLSALFGPLLALVSYLTMLAEYFQCELSDYKESQVRLLLTGIGHFEGYQPSWHRHPSNMPWIYPPVYTWLYILGAVLVAIVAWWTHATIRTSRNQTKKLAY